MRRIVPLIGPAGSVRIWRPFGDALRALLLYVLKGCAGRNASGSGVPTSFESTSTMSGLSGPRIASSSPCSALGTLSCFSVATRSSTRRRRSSIRISRFRRRSCARSVPQAQRRAWLPPPQRRGLIFVDPPYEESRQDLERVTSAIVDALQRFSTGVYAAWYPIKDEREVRAWHDEFARAVSSETLVGEMWLYPRDSKVALNGSGMLIVNPPYQLAERMQVWLPELQARLDVGHPGGTSVTMLTRP